MRINKKPFIISLVVLGIFSSFAFSRPDFNVGKNLEILFNIVKSINLHYVDSIDNDDITKRAADAMLSSLDPYTEYITKEDSEQFRQVTTGKYGGLGSAIRKPYNSQYVIIDDIYKDYPIYDAGINPGDSILKVDSVDMKNASNEDVSNAMRGLPGSKVNMTIKAIKDGSITEKTLIRKTISISPITYAGMLDDSTGYVGFNSFSSGSGEMLRTEFAKLKQNKNMKSFILDLRNNGGGIIDESVTVLSAFLPKGSFVTSLKGRNNVLHKEYHTSIEPIDTVMPLVVLINNSSASASEIVSGAIQDYDRGVIVGTKSVGKGLAQRTEDIGFGGILKITIAKYYIPSGRCIQAIDYSNRDSDNTANKVQDSLRNEFKTKAGRTVLDGGGIEPDVIVSPTYLNIFTISLMARGYISDFANLYHSKHDKIASIDSFEFTDEDFNQFKEFVKDKPIKFSSVTSNKMKDVTTWAKREGYYDKLKENIEAIEKELAYRNTEKSLTENQKVLKEILALDVINKYYFISGRTELALKTDDYIIEAKKVLNDKKEYSNILIAKETVTAK